MVREIRISPASSLTLTEGGQAQSSTKRRSEVEKLAHSVLERSEKVAQAAALERQKATKAK